MKFHIKDGRSEPPADRHYYIVARNGIFLRKSNPVLETVVPVNRIPVLEFQREIVDVKYPRIPKANVLEILSFFFRNYRRYWGESIVLIHFSPTEGYMFHAPNQRVARGMLDYSPTNRFNGYLLVGSIHCHGNMVAFHSRGHEFSDHEDEVDFDGLHITIGNINSPVITVSSSVMVNGRRFMLNPVEYMGGISEVKVPKIGMSPWWGESKPTGIRYHGGEGVSRVDLYDTRPPLSLYWAPMTGRKNWIRIVQSLEKRNSDRKSMPKKLGLIDRLMGRLPDTDEERPVEYLGNPFDSRIPFFFSFDLPEGQELKKIGFPEEWSGRVSRCPLKERLKVARSWLERGEYGM